jgi:hypothetical protein
MKIVTRFLSSPIVKENAFKRVKKLEGSSRYFLRPRYFGIKVVD